MATKDRVNKILQLIAEHGYVTVKEIMMISGSEKQAYRYIKSMVFEDGSIDSFPTGLKPSTAYSLTKKGANYLSDIKLFRVSSVFKPGDFGPTEFYHNIAIVQARLFIEKHPLFMDIETPRVLLARLGIEKELKPDAEISFRESLDPDSKVLRAGLEVELHPKWHKRNEKKMKLFDSRKYDDLKSIIWVCSNTGVYSALCAAIVESKVLNPFKHRFVYLEELHTKGSTGCCVIDYKGKPCGLFL